jgi:curved DNA binding protein
MSKPQDKMDVTEDETQQQPQQQQQQQQQQQDETLANPTVAQKYKYAADIVNETLVYLIKQIAVGKKAVELCDLGDKFIMDSVSGVFKKIKKMPKGIAFPTCVNVNEIVCHYSPLAGDELVLQQGDTVRLDVGVHIDGFIAVGATTVVLQEGVIEGERAHVFAAAQTAIEVAKRLIKPGHTNTEVSRAINQVTADFGVNMCEGVLSHEMKRFIIDGNNVILSKPTPDHTVDEFKFEENQVFALDIVVSSGEGKLSERTYKPTIYKRNPSVTYNLKNPTSKQFLKEVQSRFETLPFTMRALDRKVGGMGVIECYRHKLVDAYPVLCEKKGAFVVQLKTTLLLTASATQQVVNPQIQNYKSDKSLQNPELKNLLHTSMKVKKKSKKTSATAAASTGESMDTSNE